LLIKSRSEAEISDSSALWQAHSHVILGEQDIFCHQEPQAKTNSSLELTDVFRQQSAVTLTAETLSQSLAQTRNCLSEFPCSICGDRGLFEALNAMSIAAKQETSSIMTGEMAVQLRWILVGRAHEMRYHLCGSPFSGALMTSAAAG